MQLVDDLGHRIALDSPPVRVVSLVPSLTESFAATGTLVGATDWCTHPADLDVPRVRGTKNPDLRAIEALRPDLVLANKEENRELDVRRLREAGVQVWVTDIEDVASALSALNRLFAEVFEIPSPDWLRSAADVWLGEPAAPVATVAIPIWRDPWMVVGTRTFTGDLVAHAGLPNAFADHSERYPHITLAEVDRPEHVDLVLLPDEPYEFTALDGPESFEQVPTRLVSGRLLTWYGPSLIEARVELDQIASEVSQWV